MIIDISNISSFLKISFFSLLFFPTLFVNCNWVTSNKDVFRRNHVTVKKFRYGEFESMVTWCSVHDTALIGRSPFISSSGHIFLLEGFSLHEVNLDGSLNCREINLAGRLMGDQITFPMEISSDDSRLSLIVLTHLSLSSISIHRIDEFNSSAEWGSYYQCTQPGECALETGGAHYLTSTETVLANIYTDGGFDPSFFLFDANTGETLKTARNYNGGLDVIGFDTSDLIVVFDQYTESNYVQLDFYTNKGSKLLFSKNISYSDENTGGDQFLGSTIHSYKYMYDVHDWTRMYPVTTYHRLNIYRMDPTTGEQEKTFPGFVQYDDFVSCTSWNHMLLEDEDFIYFWYSTSNWTDESSNSNSKNGPFIQNNKNNEDSNFGINLYTCDAALIVDMKRQIPIWRYCFHSYNFTDPFDPEEHARGSSPLLYGQATWDYNGDSYIALLSVYWWSGSDYGLSILDLFRIDKTVSKPVLDPKPIWSRKFMANVDGIIVQTEESGEDGIVQVFLYSRCDFQQTVTSIQNVIIDLNDL